MNNNPYGKLTLMMKQTIMTLNKVAATSNRTIVASNGATTTTGADAATMMTNEQIQLRRRRTKQIWQRWRIT